MHCANRALLLRRGLQAKLAYLEHQLVWQYRMHMPKRPHFAKHTFLQPPPHVPPARVPLDEGEAAHERVPPEGPRGHAKVDVVVDQQREEHGAQEGRAEREVRGVGVSAHRVVDQRARVVVAQRPDAVAGGGVVFEVHDLQPAQDDQGGEGVVGRVVFGDGWHALHDGAEGSYTRCF